MSRSIAARACVVAVLVLLLSSCEKNHYDIEITPQEQGMKRELICYRQGDHDKLSAFSRKELESIAKIYDGKVPADLAQKHRFEGRFQDRTPQDVGGAGWYATWPTPLGTSYAYAERFRGDIDLVGSLERRQKGADQFVDHLIGWLKEELGSEPYFDRLHKMLDVEFRCDLKNLSLLSMTTLARPGEEKDQRMEEFLARAGIYLAERGYFTPQDIPALGRMIHSEKPVEKLPERVVRMLATKAGIAKDQPLPPKLQRLTDFKVLDASMKKYAETTADYRQLLEKWKARPKSESDSKKPDPGKIFGDPLDAAMLGQVRFLSESDKVTIRLKTGVQPYHTNGKWDAKKKSVSWSISIATRTDPLDEWPRYCSALWSVPDDKAQEKCFGRVLLKEKGLGEYCVWYRGLTADESRQWDALLAGPAQGDELLKKIEAFRFTGDPPVPPVAPDEKEKKKTPSLADTPRSLIEVALKAKGGEKK